jgi:hypothetical protein
MTTHATMMTHQEKTRSYNEQALGNDLIPITIETYGCFHFPFDSFFIACAQTTITHHQRSSLVLFMLLSYYQQHVFIVLQHAQGIMIFQHVVTLGRGSSSLPHILPNAPSSLANFWQRIALSS